MNKCAWHSCSNMTLKKFCDSKCKNKYFVDKRRKALKRLAFEYKGSQCYTCNYSNSIWAMEFHHLDPTQKDFTLSTNGHTRSWERTKKELDKCIMVCANCHREIHHGIRTV